MHRLRHVPVLGSLAWVPTLVQRDLGVGVLANLACVAYLMALLWDAGRVFWSVVALLGLSQGYTEYALLQIMAWASIYQSTYWVSGLLALMLCRLVMRSKAA